MRSREREQSRNAWQSGGDGIDRCSRGVNSSVNNRLVVASLTRMLASPGPRGSGTSDWRGYSGADHSWAIWKLPCRLRGHQPQSPKWDLLVTVTLYTVRKAGNFLCTTQCGLITLRTLLATTDDSSTQMHPECVTG